jgi:hypothetical protein
MALGVLAILATSPSAARANCAAPVTYELSVEGSTVRIQPTGGTRGCPDPDGLLRQSGVSGETVLLADFCGAEPAPGLGAPYVDECVPPGLHRYGFARPYDCARSACGTFRFAEVEVTAPLAAGCERSAGNAAPTPVGAPAWTEQNRLICGYGSDDDELGEALALALEAALYAAVARPLELGRALAASALANGASFAAGLLAFPPRTW